MTLNAHTPILLVVLPLLAAPLCALLRSNKLAWLSATFISWLVLALSCGMAWTVWHKGQVIYELGGWAPPWGIAYHLDALNSLVLLLVAGISALTFTYAGPSLRQELSERQQPLCYALLLLCLAGLLGITLTGDAFNMYVFLEISSLSSYSLISLGRDRRALTSAYQYLIMGTIGATFILIGIGLLYSITGTLNFLDLAQRLTALPGAQERILITAMAFLTVGIGLKLALFPLHLWLPNAYAFAPSAVTVFLAATATKVAVYMLLRFSFTVIGPQLVFGQLTMGRLLLIPSLAGIVIASLVAIFQNDIKRMLAYSSVAQIGYMTLAISLSSTTGLMAGMLHMFNHALMKGALFMALGAVCYRLGSIYLTDFNGLGRRMPWTMAAFVAGGLSLIGVPATVGFVSKWYLISAALERNWWPVAIIIVAGSLLALIYIWRVVERAYFYPAQHLDEEDVTEAPWGLLVPTWILIAANIYFGLDTRVSLNLAHKAATVLLGGSGL